MSMQDLNFSSSAVVPKFNHTGNKVPFEVKAIQDKHWEQIQEMIQACIDTYSTIPDEMLEKICRSKYSDLYLSASKYKHKVESEVNLLNAMKQANISDEKIKEIAKNAGIEEWIVEDALKY